MPLCGGLRRRTFLVTDFFLGAQFVYLIPKTAANKGFERCAPRSAHPPFCDCAPKRFKEQRVDLRPFTILSLCAGVGGLDLGLRVAQPNSRTVCFVEIEAYAAAILATRMELDALDQAPISNLR